MFAAFPPYRGQSVCAASVAPVTSQRTSRIAVIITYNLSMKAIRFHEYGGPEVTRLEDIPQPDPKPGELLIRTAAAGVNAIDWKLRSGILKQFMPLQLPFSMGCDVAGVVEKGAGKFQPGDEVYGYLVTLRSGAFAESAIALESEIALKPKTLSFNEAASIPVAVLTAYEALFDHGKLAFRPNGSDPRRSRRSWSNGRAGSRNREVRA